MVTAKGERKRAGEKMPGAGGTPRLGRETNIYKGAELQGLGGGEMRLFDFILEDL